MSAPANQRPAFVLLLEEVLLDADARRAHPDITGVVEVHGDHLVGRFTTVSIEEVDITGAIPKGVSYSDLGFGLTEAPVALPHDRRRLEHGQVT